MNPSVFHLLRHLRDSGTEIHTKKWQGVEAPQPMLEVLNATLYSSMASIVDEAAMQWSPNLPWADLHFDERVGGIPSNPGNTYNVWPFWRGGHLDGGEFTHTYQQRLWTNPLEGIRYRYGNLGSVVELLKREPDTRQAFVPIWFPEDTGVKHGGRVPCSLGYHFIIRNNEFHVTYYLRSCDARRHLFDDLYLCNRLALWVRDQVNQEWNMGQMHVHITSLHVFESDTFWLMKTVQKYEEQCAE